MTDQPVQSEGDATVTYLVTDFDRLQGGVFYDAAAAGTEAARIAGAFPGNTVHVLRTYQTHRAGRPMRSVEGRGPGHVVPDDVVARAMHALRSVSVAADAVTPTDMRHVLEAIWPAVPRAFDVRIDTMREAEKGESYTVTLYHPDRPSNSTIFDGEGRMEIYHTYKKENADHTLCEWREFLGLAPSDQGS